MYNYNIYNIYVLCIIIIYIIIYIYIYIINIIQRCTVMIKPQSMELFYDTWFFLCYA